MSGEVVQILLGNGDGTFGIGASYGVDDAESIVAADLRNNGKTDLAVCIFPGKGDGTFGSPDISYPVASNSFP